MSLSGLTRRAAVQALMSLAALANGARRAGAHPADRGIGGTGVAADPDDRGIGGTGLVGTIRDFGSIVVNDVHVAYPPDAIVIIDDQPSTPAALQLGHIVRLLARQTGSGLTTDHIRVMHEVVGRIDRVIPDGLVVLGQTVLLDGATAPPALLRRGQRVAVSGLRQPDGRILASRVDRASPGLDRVMGLPRRRDGAVAIGDLAIAGLHRALLDGRAVLTGRRRLGRFRIASQENEWMALAAAGATDYAVETLVERAADAVAAGGGYDLSAVAATTVLPERQIVRAVLTGVLDNGGRFSTRAATVGGAAIGVGQRPSPPPHAAPKSGSHASETRPEGPSRGVGFGHTGRHGPGAFGGPSRGPGGVSGKGPGR